jgi:DNA-directed RNA polymerase specialized sigma24 family protein
MTETAADPVVRRSRQRGPIPYPDRRRLLAVQRRIDDGKKAADERAELMRQLYTDHGFSYQAIAEVLGVQHEMVRKAILSRSDAGYPHR